MRRTFDDLSPIRGATKVVPEDFEVEEISDGEPDGEGPHLLLWVEKRGRNTNEVVQELHHALRVPRPEIGVAGRKDRQSVSRQWISVPAHAVSNQLPEGDGWRVLSAQRHGSKLRTGHLAGNRFRIRVRGGAPGKSTARLAFDRLTTSGLPNYFGSQRFGRKHDNELQGRKIVLGKLFERNRNRRRFYISALQSALFNSWLDRRIDDGLLDTAISGDLIRSRSSFPGTAYQTLLKHYEGDEADRSAVAEGKSDPTGPIFGARMAAAREEAAAREDAVLEAAGLDASCFLSLDRDAPGGRRPARAWVQETSVEIQEADLILSFALERGAYATVLLYELGL